MAELSDEAKQRASPHAAAHDDTALFATADDTVNILSKVNSDEVSASKTS
jgi:hypothetical protein